MLNTQSKRLRTNLLAKQAKNKIDFFRNNNTQLYMPTTTKLLCNIETAVYFDRQMAAAQPNPLSKYAVFHLNAKL